MRYLLDTHALIWYSGNPTKLPNVVRDTLNNPKSKLFISVASLWEIAIKIGAGKLEIVFDELLERLKLVDIMVMPVENEYLTQLIKLPFIHKDPFDRLIIVTAQATNMTVVTIDENIQKYDVPWIW